ncbi:MAG: mechanosensitive ion channel [Cyanobacteria bacterium]|jgi:MscS family membrane protein|nr:mechanosensitive ion channel [Cyanobacteria bacterium GSL.Bin1]
MNFLETFQQALGIDAELQRQLLAFGIRLGWFILFTLLAVLVGLTLPSFLRSSVHRFAPDSFFESYKRLVGPLRQLVIRSGILAVTAININLFRVYPGLYDFLKLVVYFPLTITVAWLLSRVIRQLTRFYGVKLIQHLNRKADDFLIVGETVANFVIGFFAVIFFAQSQSINLISLLTGVGIGGVAVAFAAKETLSQVVGTIILYLDRPYLPGEYIRANFNPRGADIYGRVESIGIRSTKIRLAAKNTLLIAPNSLMVSMDVENISRGTKVMVLFYLDFARVLDESESALVYKVIEESFHKELSGLDPGGIQIALFELEDQPVTRARINLFIRGSNEKSLAIRKRLVEIANESITKQLQTEGLQFEFAEPTIYVDSPVPL